MGRKVNRTGRPAFTKGGSFTKLSGGQIKNGVLQNLQGRYSFLACAWRLMKGIFLIISSLHIIPGTYLCKHF